MADPELEDLISATTAHAHALNEEVQSLIRERDGHLARKSEEFYFDFLLDHIRTVEIPCARAALADLRRTKTGEIRNPGAEIGMSMSDLGPAYINGKPTGRLLSWQAKFRLH